MDHERLGSSNFHCCVVENLILFELAVFAGCSCDARLEASNSHSGLAQQGGQSFLFMDPLYLNWVAETMIQ